MRGRGFFDDLLAVLGVRLSAVESAEAIVAFISVGAKVGVVCGFRPRAPSAVSTQTAGAALLLEAPR